MGSTIRSNFDVLKRQQPQLWRLGALAERYFADDPNTCLLKLRQLTEILAQTIAARSGLYTAPEETQYELIRRLQDTGVVPREVRQLFDQVRTVGNAASHALKDDHGSALSSLKLCWQLSLWYHRTFTDSSFKSGPFMPPAAPVDESLELQAELHRLRDEVLKYQASHQQTAEQLQAAQAQLSAQQEASAFWEQLASEVEQDKAKLAHELAQQQATAAVQPKSALAKLVKSASSAASLVQLDEADTRQLIDAQLRQAGWDTDSEQLRFSKGTRPQKSKNMAIAEWPCDGYSADYVLFMGLTPVAVVEAKRKNIDVSAALQQAKRYSRTFSPSVETVLHDQNWGAQGEFRIPLVFSSNGRDYLKQLATKSGIWFCDLRRPDNTGHPLQGWHTPEGLKELLKRDEAQAHADLAIAPFNYGLKLRPYQQDAIRATESAIEAGQREILLAMATGTGKTKTCIALIYRLLKARRFNRILFLVDRSALGEQAANAFKDTRMENLQTFADTFGIKELDEATPDSATKVHIATVQGMVQRVLYASEGNTPPPIDQYDCIVVDECHRGYLLDRELSDTELSFRGYEDYISSYRRVLDYFDAVKVGLTATPALHTSQIFGAPIFSYSYREAVIDGYLVDYEPPIQIKTELSTQGMLWDKGAVLKVYNVAENQVELYKAPDAIKLEVDAFNRKVITESFNRVVCEYLAQELDPAAKPKTLVFCVNDAHADLVVHLLKEAFAKQYGSVDDDAVIKITGAADKPLSLILRYKNERQPNVAVTVDLLTTGIDVPEICNLVFLRQVNSRILFDQMLGRATRLCDFDGEGNKDTFRVFDAVQIFDALQNMTAMKPVVVNPKISFAQLHKELATVGDDSARQLVRDQFLAKLQSKKRHLDDQGLRDFEAKAGMKPDDFVNHLKAMPLAKVAQWFTQNPDLGELLDRKAAGGGQPMFISEHPDHFISADRGFGKAKKPKDFLDEFKTFITSHSNEIPALMAVMQRPRELTRQQLRDLQLRLDQAGFTEVNLDAAWREMTNQDIAARIVGYIRQAALGDALQPYAERVDHALQKLLANPVGGKPWTGPQRDWLKRIAAQTKANLLVDREALDDPDLIFKREGGGFTRLDKVFNGGLQLVLDAFNDSVWAA
jgi:type I restriction enzyme R subunit